MTTDARLYLGLDPGASGGLAALTATGDVHLVAKIPDSMRDLVDLLSSLPRPQCRAALEFVRSSPQMGVASAFAFGRAYGALRMALVSAGIAFEEVTPNTWQKALRCQSGGDKSVTRTRAQELFPGIKVTHAIADALLLAEYARRLEVRA